MKQVNIYEARGQLSRLLEEVEGGEEILIARNGKPIVRLTPVNPPRRVLGRWQGQVPPLSEADWQASDEGVSAAFKASLDGAP